MAKFAVADREDPPPQGANLFVGSSSIRLWDLDEHFPTQPVVNRGFGGSHIADAVHYLDRLVLRHRPSVVVLYAGDNDIAAGKSPQRVARDFGQFARQIHKTLPKTRIVFIAIKPSLARWKLVERMREANRLIRKQTSEHALLEFVDIDGPMLNDNGEPRDELFVKDGLHMSKEGYKLWSKLVRPHLAED